MGMIFTKLLQPALPPPVMAPTLHFLPPYDNQEDIEVIVKSYLEDKELTS